jgi:formylglycine-generating enzyme required for sulfatase activity
MKRFLKVLPGAIAGILGALLWAGCSNQFSPAPEASGQGLVSIRIGGGESRTLFPDTLAFNRYELRFTPEEGQEARESVTVYSPNYTSNLVAGAWTITAVAYMNISDVEGIPNGEYEAARGSKGLTVIPEQANSVDIDIRGGTENGQGVFKYELSYPPVDAAALKILSLPDESSVKEVDLLSEGVSYGSFVLDTGYYILHLELKKGRGTITKIEVIHIYNNMSTTAGGTDYTFSDDDFLFTVDTDTDIPAGTMTRYAAGDVFFGMAAVPGRITFPTGTDDRGTAMVRNPYQIGETEVTWELWDTVRTWALANGYDNIAGGSKGTYGSTGNILYNQHPVAPNDWPSIMLWCNALTEYWNEKTGDSLDPVYFMGGEPIRNTYSGTTNITPVLHARGFRLPTSYEWELAARWQGENDLGNSVEKDGYYYTRGDSASGALGSYTNTAATGIVAVYGSSTEEIKTKAPNALNLYDMSGNLAELCFELSAVGAAECIFRGGGAYAYQDYERLQVGYSYGPFSLPSDSTWGFRLARTGYKAGELPTEVNAPIAIGFTGPDDETLDIVISIETDITQDPYYEYDPSWPIPVLQNNEWYDDSDPSPSKYYQFYAHAGSSYLVQWNDSLEGDGTKTASIRVSASWKADNAKIFESIPVGYSTRREFIANRSGIVSLMVTPYAEPPGTFALRYSGRTDLLDIVSQTDTLVFSAPAGYEAYQWFVDNNFNAEQGNSLTLQCSPLSLGPHTLTLVVYKQEGNVQVPYSKEISFTVEP